MGKGYTEQYAAGIFNGGRGRNAVDLSLNDADKGVSRVMSATCLPICVNIKEEHDARISRLATNSAHRMCRTARQQTQSMAGERNIV